MTVLRWPPCDSRGVLSPWAIGASGLEHEVSEQSLRPSPQHSFRAARVAAVSLSCRWQALSHAMDAVQARGGHMPSCSLMV